MPEIPLEPEAVCLFFVLDRGRFEEFVVSKLRKCGNDVSFLRIRSTMSRRTARAPGCPSGRWPQSGVVAQWHGYVRTWRWKYPWMPTWRRHGTLEKKKGRFIFSQSKKCFWGERTLPLFVPFNVFRRLLTPYWRFANASQSVVGRFLKVLGGASRTTIRRTGITSNWFQFDVIINCKTLWDFYRIWRNKLWDFHRIYIKTFWVLWLLHQNRPYFTLFLFLLKSFWFSLKSFQY